MRNTQNLEEKISGNLTLTEAVIGFPSVALTMYGVIKDERLYIGLGAAGIATSTFMLLARRWYRSKTPG